MEAAQFHADEQGDEVRSKDIQKGLEKLYEHRTQMLFQKARIRWNLEGDRNTKFLHNMVRFKWSKNKIWGVQDGRDRWIENPDQVKHEFYQYYQGFF